MAIRYRYLLLLFVPLLLVGCGTRAFGGIGTQTEAVSETTVTRTLQFLDESGRGQRYEVSFSVPESWVGTFETRSKGNNIAFSYVQGNRRATIFTVEALSGVQYWEQIGSYPGYFTNIATTPDTYFVYHLPIDSFYSGLSEADFEALAAEVPAVATSISVMPVE